MKRAKYLIIRIEKNEYCFGGKKNGYCILVTAVVFFLTIQSGGCCGSEMPMVTTAVACEWWVGK
jgi:hypothetical protein